MTTFAPTLDEVVERIEHNVKLISAELSTMSPRQQTLISVLFIDMGYLMEILNDDVPGAEDDPSIELGRSLAQHLIDNDGLPR